MARYAPLYFRGLRFWRLSRIPVPTKNGAPRAPRRPRARLAGARAACYRLPLPLVFWFVACACVLLGLRPRAVVAAVGRPLRGGGLPPSARGTRAPRALSPALLAGRAVSLSLLKSSLRSAFFRLSPRAVGVSPRPTRRHGRLTSPLPTSAGRGCRGYPSLARAFRSRALVLPAAPLRGLPPPSFAWARYALNPTLRRPSMGFSAAVPLVRLAAPRLVAYSVFVPRALPATRVPLVALGAPRPFGLRESGSGVPPPQSFYKLFVFFMVARPTACHAYGLTNAELTLRK